jgi:hypothetical protein
LHSSSINGNGHALRPMVVLMSQGAISNAMVEGQFVRAQTDACAQR